MERLLLNNKTRTFIERSFDKHISDITAHKVSILPTEDEKKLLKILWDIKSEILAL